VTEHLDPFDQMHGLDSRIDLKSAAKAGSLKRHFGETEFNYMRDAYPDLPVWRQAQKAITVDAA
jgi:hypothetical protein